MLTVQDWLGIGNLVVLTATGIVVFIYTRAAQQSNEIQEKPIIHLFFEETTRSGSSRDGRLKIKNIGKGPAYNISFHEIKLQEAPRGTFTYKFHISDPLMEAGKEMEPKPFILTPTGGSEFSGMSRFLFRLVPQSMTNDAVRSMIENPAIFLINYDGLYGGRYYSIFKFYSTLPPVGGMVMQFVKYGSGRCGIERARRLAKKIPNIRSAAQETREAASAD